MGRGFTSRCVVGLPIHGETHHIWEVTPWGDSPYMGRLPVYGEAHGCFFTRSAGISTPKLLVHAFSPKHQPKTQYPQESQTESQASQTESTVSQILCLNSQFPTSNRAGRRRRRTSTTSTGKQVARVRGLAPMPSRKPWRKQKRPSRRPKPERRSRARH